MRDKSVKKVDTGASDEPRPEYKRPDFAELVRGKYANSLAKKCNVVVLDPEVSKAFPNDKAVDEALRGLLRSGKATYPNPPLPETEAQCCPILP